LTPAGSRRLISKLTPIGTLSAVLWPVRKLQKKLAGTEPLSLDSFEAEKDRRRRWEFGRLLGLKMPRKTPFLDS